MYLAGKNNIKLSSDVLQSSIIYIGKGRFTKHVDLTKSHLKLWDRCMFQKVWLDAVASSTFPACIYIHLYTETIPLLKLLIEWGHYAGLPIWKRRESIWSSHAESLGNTAGWSALLRACSLPSVSLNALDGLVVPTVINLDHLGNWVETPVHSGISDKVSPRSDISSEPYIIGSTAELWDSGIKCSHLR